LRLVSPVEPLKGRLICAVRGMDGRRLSLEIAARGLSKHDIKALSAAWERGDIFGVPPETLSPLGTEGCFRVAADALAPLYQARRVPLCATDGGVAETKGFSMSHSSH
jgi:hypothetical protein